MSTCSECGFDASAYRHRHGCTRAQPLEMKVIWTECCGHYFPKRVPEEHRIWVDPDGDEVQEGPGQVKEFWEKLKGKTGKLVFIED